jgi:hypothetical protein
MCVFVFKDNFENATERNREILGRHLDMSVSYEDIIKGSGAMLEPECSEKKIISLLVVRFVKHFKKQRKIVGKVEKEITGDL